MDQDLDKKIEEILVKVFEWEIEIADAKEAIKQLVNQSRVKDKTKLKLAFNRAFKLGKLQQQDVYGTDLNKNKLVDLIDRFIS